MYCPHCGAQNPPEAKYCGNCGKDLSGLLEKQEKIKTKDQEGQHEDKSPFFKFLFSFGRKRKLVITFGVVVIAMISVTYFVSSDGKTDNNNFITTQTAQAVKELGTKLDLDNIDLYYTSSVTREDAERLGEYLKTSNYFNDNNKVVAQIDRDSRGYILKYEIKPGDENNKEYLGDVEHKATEISRFIFRGIPVEIALTDSKFQTLKIVSQNTINDKNVITTPKNNKENYGGLVMEVNGSKLFYTKSIREIEARRIGEMLEKIGFFSGSEKIVQLSVDEKTLIFKQILSEGKEKDDSYLKEAKSNASLIANKGFSKSTFEYMLTDANLKVINIIKHNPNPSSVDYGKLIEHEGAKFYYTESIKEIAAKRIADILFKKGFFNGKIKTVQFSIDNKKYLVREIFPKGTEMDERILESGKSTVEFLKKNIFGTRPFEIQLTDVNLKVYYSIKSGF